jgi:hypothetical protein
LSAGSSLDLGATLPLGGVVLRLVEQQGAQATRRITGSLEEQAYLEEFLEASKPELPSEEECPQRHRLLLTPFRYSKRHGSRFSSRFERGLFYGSRSRQGCLVEGAYYGLVFQSGPEHPFPEIIALRKTLFHVEICAERGLQLHHQGDEAVQSKLRDPCDYRFSQAWGAQMREIGIQGFEYHSARSADPVIQFAAFTCGMFSSTPFDQVEVAMEVNEKGVGIRCLDDNKVWYFSLGQFLVKGLLPAPAA